MNEEKEVYFDQYCKSCKHHGLEESKDPCNDCLAEPGEAIDILKKHLFQGHELDTAHMAKELGDVAWYLAVSANAIGYDLETIMQMNVDKLKARYPDGFDAEHSLHRNQDDI